MAAPTGGRCKRLYRSDNRARYCARRFPLLCEYSGSQALLVLAALFSPPSPPAALDSIASPNLPCSFFLFLFLLHVYNRSWRYFFLAWRLLLCVRFCRPTVEVGGEEEAEEERRTEQKQREREVSRSTWPPLHPLSARCLGRTDGRTDVNGCYGSPR